MSENAANKPRLSSLDSRLLTILLTRVVVVTVLMGMVFATVGMTQARGAPMQHASGVPRVQSALARNDARTAHANDRVALPTQPITAARDLVHTVGGVQRPCYPRNVKQWYLERLGCPVTPEYRRYLLTHSRDADPVCGCQNYALHNTFHELFQRAGLAAVAATLTFTYNTVYIVFVEVKRGTGWAVTANYVTHI